MSARHLDPKVGTPLVAEPLTPAGFAAFGDVIATDGEAVPINQGMAERYPDLAGLSFDAEQGRPAISRVACRPEHLPVTLRLLERHPLGSQAFIPLDGQRYLVAVAPPGERPDISSLRVFWAGAHQGINYHPGVWHHPLIALDRHCEFLEVHRAGPGRNCDEQIIESFIQVALPASQTDTPTRGGRS